MRKKNEVTLYDGGFLVAIVIVAIVFLIGVVKENLKRDPHFYDYKPTDVNWGQFFNQTSKRTKEEQKTLRYNWSTNKWEYAYSEEILRYNWSTRYWEYAFPDEQLKYNWSTGYWEY